MTTLLIIFAKEPVPGQVKTRLCPPLDAAAAARLYQAFLSDILEEMARLPELNLALAYTPAEAQAYFQRLVPRGVSFFPQEGADLGERMARAFDRGFAAGYETVLLRGSDTPDLPGAVVLEAATLLKTGASQLALGPSPDGGYYLVGLTAPQPELFRQVAWSGTAVLAETLERARRLRLKIHLLPEWQDIDTESDLAAFARRPHPTSGPGWRSHRLALEFLAAAAAVPLSSGSPSLGGREII